MTILSITLLGLPTSGIGLASFQIANQNAPNGTQIQPSESQQPSSEAQLKPFTIPRGDNGNSQGPSNSQISAQGNDEDNFEDDMILLNQNYDNERFGDRLVGELLNNGTETAEFVQVSASFYDEDGIFLGSSSGYTEPSSIPPGGRAGFNILITSDTIEDDSERYEFSIQWNDDDFDQHTIRITGEEAESNDNDNDNDNNDNRESRIIISSLSEPQTDPRNDPKYDSIDWQDDRGEEYNLSQEEMDEILEEREEEENDGGGDSDSSDGGGDSDSSDGGGDSDSSDGGGDSDSSDGGRDNFSFD